MHELETEYEGVPIILRFSVTRGWPGNKLEAPEPPEIEDIQAFIHGEKVVGILAKNIIDDKMDWIEDQVSRMDFSR